MRKIFCLIIILAGFSHVDMARCEEKKSLNIAVMISTTREARVGKLVANQVVKQLKEEGYIVTLIDPLEHNLPMLDKRLSDYEQGKAPAKLQKLGEQLVDADAYIVVSAIYNGSVPAALKNLIDHFNWNQFKQKPVALISYSAGSYGGAQVISQWRSIFPVLGAITIPSSMSIPSVNAVFTKDGKVLDEKLPERISKFIHELDWYATALKNQTENSPLN